MRAHENHQNEDNDWLQNFINEFCDVNNEFSVRAGEFLTAYKDYAARTGETSKKAGVINSALENVGFKRQKIRNGVIIKGLRLRR